MTTDWKDGEKGREHQKGAKSIYRTITLLRTIAEYNQGGINLSHLARKTSLPVATVHRIVAVLVSEALISYDPISKCYRLGFGLFALGHKAQQFSIRDTYRKSIEQIAEKTGETVYLVVRSGFDSLCIDLVEGEFPIRIMAFEVGDRRPLGVGAGGLALLAFLPNSESSAILEANRDRYRDYNNMSAERVRALVDISRELGHVFNNGNYLAGVTAVGVPVYGPDGTVIAAISVAGISERMDKERSAEIAETICKTIKVRR
jgi:DNA-binding IclR family transcriptional regulator